MIHAIDPIILLAVGFLLIALEVFIASFYVIWFGIASIVLGALSFIIQFPNGLWQLGLISILSIALLLLLKNKTIEKFLGSNNNKEDENFLNRPGTGEYINGMVFYKGTYWKIGNLDIDKSKLLANQIVYIERTEKDLVFLTNLS
jgi:membrane protein implicated in regulation of membrane protease activity